MEDSVMMWAKIKLAAACLTGAVVVGGVGTPVAIKAIAQEKRQAAEENVPRIGFEENFDTADGWKTTGKTPLKSVVVKNGTVQFNVHRQAFGEVAEMIKKFPEFNENNLFNAGTNLLKKYDVTIDFETYRYIVIKMDEMFNGIELFVCGIQVPVTYTTGVRAYDLHLSSKKLWGGKKKLSIALTIGGTGGWVTFDYIRFVRELTEEERKGLIPLPVEYKKEKLEALPFHNLQAMNTRAGRTRRIECEGQLLTYTDTLSGGEVWKLTDQPGDQYFNPNALPGRTGRTADGRYFQMLGGRGGRNVWDAGKGKWHEFLPNENYPYPSPKYVRKESRLHPGVVYGFRCKWYGQVGQKKVDFIFYRFDRRTGKEDQFGRFTYDTGKNPDWIYLNLQHGMGDKFIVGLSGTFHCIIVDPDNPDPAKKVQPLKLPVRIKTVLFRDNDTSIIIGHSWTYEALKMDLATRTIRPCPIGYGGSHGGRPLWYSNGMILKESKIENPYRPGGSLKIFANYKDPLPVDYGKSFDDRWWVVNGSMYSYSLSQTTEFKNQHLLIDHEDCSTIMRLNGFNLSYNRWSTRPYSYASPDAGTKISWCSDQFGDGDIYYVVARRPDPPRKIRLRKSGEKVELSWGLPEHSAETAGYIVYGLGRDNVFRPVNKELVKTTKWSGRVPKDITRFAIAAWEWSGLESFLSPVMKSKNDRGPDTLHLDVWLSKKSKTARVVFGRGSFGTRSVRYFKATPLETMPATVTWDELSIPKRNISIFARFRPDAQEGEWKWKKLSSGYRIKDNSITIDVPKEVLLDKVIVSNDKGYQPKTFDDRFTAPKPVKNVKAEVSKDGLIKITWDKPDSIELSHVEVHSGTKKELACDNTTAVGAVTVPQQQKFMDWDMKPGSTVYYTLVSVSTRGKRGKPVTVSVDIPSVKQLVYAEAGLEKAKAGAGLEKVEKKGEKFYAPKPIKENKKADPKSFVPLDFSFEVPTDGKYSVWVRYCPGCTKRRNIGISLDGKDAGPWRVRAPYRDMSFRTKRPLLIFTDRLILNKNQETLELKKGRHTIRFMLDPAVPGGRVHAIGKIWVSNDPSFRPQSYNPRADFEKGLY